MQTVKHKMFGLGEVVGREEKEDGAYITVRFESGKTMLCAIPDSFTIGIMVAEGDLKNEVDAAIAEKQAREQAKLEKFKTASTMIIHNTSSNRRGRVPASHSTVKGSIELAFEEYLANAGYCEHTASGHPSTVFAYTHAIKKVLEEEGISWHLLQSDIENIVPVYDVGGVKQHIGAQSNRTVICALRRFNEFING